MMNEEKNIKELPKGWKWMKLGEVCDTTSGGTPSRREPKYYNGNIPWVKSGELDKGLITDTEEKISEEAIKNSSAKIFPKGTLLIALYGATIGKLAFLGIDAATNQAVCGIYKNEIVDSNFLYNFLFHKKSKLVKQGFGGAQPNISQTILKDLDISLPPLPTQHAIVAKIEALLSEVDKGTETLRQARQQLKVYRQAVLKWAFEGKLTNENVKEGELPEGWKKVVLGDVCESVEYGSATKSKESGKVPVLRMGNIQNGRFNWDDLVYTDDDNEIKKYLLKKDDVLFNRTNSAELVGKTAIYKEERPAIFAGYLIRINRIKELLNANFINYYLNSLDAKKYGNSVRSFGVNQSNINGTKLKSYPLSLPPLTEQEKIVQEIESRLSVADKLEESIAQSLQQAEALKQSILKKAFEGRLVQEEAVAFAPQSVKLIPHERKVLAARIMYLMHDTKHFGLTKFQKMLYLVESFAQVDYEVHFIQERAGPYDRDFTMAFRKEMKEKDWFDEEQKGAITKFIPGTQVGSIIKDAAVYFRKISRQFTFVIQHLQEMDTHQAELIATLYAVWNNRLIKKKPIKIDHLITDFFNWSPKKKEEFQEEEVVAMYNWMRQAKFTPSGFGKVIGE